MAHAKISLLGAGSFVFGPSFLHDVLVDHRLDGVHLALMDPNRQAVELMADVARRFALDAGVKATVTAHTDRGAAIDGADFVACSAARELHRRFQMDCDIVDRLSPGHLVTEFGGIAGISYSLRQIALIQEICADMRRLCPRAMLLNTANPLPRVCQAASEEGVTTIGFCSAALYGYASLWRILRGELIDYPFEPAISQLRVTMGGVNHFSWAVDLREATSGRDLMPQLIASVRAGTTTEQRMTERLLLETGAMPMAGDAHIRDFLAPTGEVGGRASAGHGDPKERQRRMQQLRDFADGKAPWATLASGRAWERPADLVAAKVTGKTLAFPALNLPNSGQVPGLPSGVYVETPATADASGAHPQTIHLPPKVLSMCRSACVVTDAVVCAARQRSRKLLAAAVELDPTITDKPAAQTALAACLEAHADVLPRYE